MLLDEEHPAYTGALADVLDPMVHTFDQLDERLPHRRRAWPSPPTASTTCRPASPARCSPTTWWPSWLPDLPDIQARLEAGEPLRIADIGCGEGWAGIYLAEAYPHVTVDGFDLDDTSIAQARKHASERGVADRVRFEVQDVTDTTFGDTYDLVRRRRDGPRPVRPGRRARRHGAHLPAQRRRARRSTRTPPRPSTPDGDPIQRLLYGFSVLHCLPAGRSHEHSAATGTVMRPATFEGYATPAGWKTVDSAPRRARRLPLLQPRPLTEPNGPRILRRSVGRLAHLHARVCRYRRLQDDLGWFARLRGGTICRDGRS